MDCGRVKYTGHAVRRMFERRIQQSAVAEVIAAGEAIEEYPTDTPYPSRLLFAAVEGRPLHVVVARDPETRLCVVVTAYEPDLAVWLPDWRTRRTP